MSLSIIPAKPALLFTGSTIPSSQRPSVNFTMTTSQLALHKPDKRTSAHNKKILSTCTWQFH